MTNGPIRGENFFRPKVPDRFTICSARKASKSRIYRRSINPSGKRFVTTFARTSIIIPAAVEFVDIAGLVQGASAGEGLGNKFLSLIREVDAIVQVVRCFEDPDIHHVAGAIDPVRDIETVTPELVLADLDAVKKRHDKLAKDAKRGDKLALAEEAVLRKLEPHLDAGKPADTLSLTPEERAIAKGCFLLPDKPTICA